MHAHVCKQAQQDAGILHPLPVACTHTHSHTHTWCRMNARACKEHIQEATIHQGTTHCIAIQYAHSYTVTPPPHTHSHTQSHTWEPLHCVIPIYTWLLCLWVVLFCGDESGEPTDESFLLLCAIACWGGGAGGPAGMCASAHTNHAVRTM